MHYECWFTKVEKHPKPKIPDTDKNLGLVHNLGGYPCEMVSFVSILGTESDRIPHSGSLLVPCPSNMAPKAKITTQVEKI